MSQPVFTLDSPADLEDLALFTGRAKQLDAEGAVRLQCAGGRLATWVSVVEGTGLLRAGTVLAMRAVAARCEQPVDVVVPLAAISDRLAARSATSVDLSVPPAQVQVAWASKVTKAHLS